jgi:hypothetical protein
VNRALPIAVAALGLFAAEAQAVPTVSRGALDPGQLVVEAPSAAGEFQDIEVHPSGTTTIVQPSSERPPPPELWTINAPDCTQNPASKQVVCTAPVTSFSFTSGDGDEVLFAGKLRVPVLAAFGAGDDFVSSGRAADVLDGGPGIDKMDGEPGDDMLIGGTEDDDLLGGSGSDVIVGAAGSDRMLGEGQVDRIKARDGAADARIACGGGSDSKERAKVDRADPEAKSC